MTESLLALIRELQNTEPLQKFCLSGGTNLTIRFNHRKSVDIDLFTNYIIGVKGWEDIKKTLQEKYGTSLLFCEILNKELGKQYCFLRALVKKGEEQVKVEMIQNVQRLDNIEQVNDIRLLSIKDIGLYKLMAASNRFAKKDIYDLDFITDQIDLETLLVALKYKNDQYSISSHKCLFDLDQRFNPVDDTTVLLAFDIAAHGTSNIRPNHSNDRLDILENGKPWLTAKASWRKKVKLLISNSSK